MYIHLIGVAPWPTEWYGMAGSHGANALAGQLRNGARPVLSIALMAAVPAIIGGLPGEERSALKYSRAMIPYQSPASRAA